MDDARLASASETERAIRFHLDTDESPLEQASGLTAYRNVVGLRKALGNWIEMRVAKAAQAQRSA